MTEETTAKLHTGTWNNLETAETERKPKVEFEMKKTVEVTLLGEPREMTSENGVYYIFEVAQDGQEKVIMTSAWTLLRGLKSVSPIKGKKVKITKDMKDGKQHYHVEQVSVNEESLGEH